MSDFDQRLKDTLQQARAKRAAGAKAAPKTPPLRIPRGKGHLQKISTPEMHKRFPRLLKALATRGKGASLDESTQFLHEFLHHRNKAAIDDAAAVKKNFEQSAIISRARYKVRGKESPRSVHEKPFTLKVEDQGGRAERVGAHLYDDPITLKV